MLLTAYLELLIADLVGKHLSVHGSARQLILGNGACRMDMISPGYYTGMPLLPRLPAESEVPGGIGHSPTTVDTSATLQLHLDRRVHVWQLLLR